VSDERKANLVKRCASAADRTRSTSHPSGMTLSARPRERWLHGPHADEWAYEIATMVETGEIRLGRKVA
jgi:hypothetical protein